MAGGKGAGPLSFSCNLHVNFTLPKMQQQPENVEFVAVGEVERDLFRERFFSLPSPPFSPRPVWVLFRPVVVTPSVFCRLFP